jgi:hypothetical protein
MQTLEERTEKFYDHDQDELIEYIIDLEDELKELQHRLDSLDK